MADPVICHRDTAKKGVPGRTGTRIEVQLTPCVGAIHVVVKDNAGLAGIEGLVYMITGPNQVAFHGKTAPGGLIRLLRPPSTPGDPLQPAIPGGRYTLHVANQDFRIEATDPKVPPTEVRLAPFPTSGMPSFAGMKPRKPGALEGRAFLAQTTGQPSGHGGVKPGGMARVPPASPNREDRILEEILDGNMPHHCRVMRPVSFREKLNGVEHEVLFFCMPDYLAIGSDDDFVRIPMGGSTAQRIADEFGYTLPTHKLVDVIYEQADVKLAPHGLFNADPIGAKMYNDAYLKHENLISGWEPSCTLHHGQCQVGTHLQLPGKVDSPHLANHLVAGHKKDVTISDETIDLRGPPPPPPPGKPATPYYADKGLSFYGLHSAVKTPTQPRSGGQVHGMGYADYLHGVRFIHHLVAIDGVYRLFWDVLADDKLRPLLYVGAWPFPTRYKPMPPGRWIA